MDGGELTKLIIEFIKKRWYRKSTLLILILFVVVVLLPLFSAINLQAVEPGEIGIGILVLSVVVTIWFYSNLPPKASNKKSDLL